MRMRDPRVEGVPPEPRSSRVRLRPRASAEPVCGRAATPAWTGACVLEPCEPTGMPGLAGTIGSTAAGSGCAADGGGATAGPGAGPGGTGFPSSAGGSTGPG